MQTQNGNSFWGTIINTVSLSYIYAKYNTTALERYVWNQTSGLKMKDEGQFSAD